MSSTNRNNTRHGADYYVTPIPAIMDFLNAWGHTIYVGDRILDPCAGGDDVNPMSYPEALRRYYGQSLQVDTVDIREDSRAEIKADYLNWQPPAAYSLVITNPPFNLALPIIQKAIQDIKPTGKVVMLLRLNFLGGQERSKWLRQNMPEQIFVHSKRMKFLNTAGTDSIEYAHFVWGKTPATQTTIHII